MRHPAPTRDLLFDDVDRLSRIVTAARRPVQLVIAGTVDAGDAAGRSPG
jgi:hypothetical protein